MPSPADQLASRKSRARGFADGFKVWNRKLHYYLGLYFLFFLWMFAFTGVFHGIVAGISASAVNADAAV